MEGVTAAGEALWGARGQLGRPVRRSRLPRRPAGPAAARALPHAGAAGPTLRESAAEPRGPGGTEARLRLRQQGGGPPQRELHRRLELALPLAGRLPRAPALGGAAELGLHVGRGAAQRHRPLRRQAREARGQARCEEPRERSPLDRRLHPAAWPGKPRVPRGRAAHPDLRRLRCVLGAPPAAEGVASEGDSNLPRRRSLCAQRSAWVSRVGAASKMAASLAPPPGTPLAHLGGVSSAIPGNPRGPPRVCAYARALLL
mmetsp:Transcript_22100/g.58910  ORF Transcript_22100/g.58910 Transcript_22100/m.58910 type:complete len:258 (-) Transcript_22100:267-1040(-)